MAKLTGDTTLVHYENDRLDVSLGVSPGVFQQMGGRAPSGRSGHRTKNQKWVSLLLG
jgi:hypothetical protein